MGRDGTGADRPPLCRIPLSFCISPQGPLVRPCSDGQEPALPFTRPIPTYRTPPPPFSPQPWRTSQTSSSKTRTRGPSAQRPWHSRSLPWLESPYVTRPLLGTPQSLHTLALGGHCPRLQHPPAKQQGTHHSHTVQPQLNIPLPKIVYEPKVKYHVGDKKPPKMSDSLFGWLPPLIHTKEPELLQKIGPDAVTFLRFLRMIRWMFTAISVLCCGILIPINVYYNLKVAKDPPQNVLLLLTIRNVRGVWLWAHVVMTYIVTFVVFAFIYLHWNAMVRMRNVWFRSPEYMDSFYARTLMIQSVPRKFQSDEGIRAIFQSMNMPYPTTSVHIGRRVGDLPDLIEKHNDTVRELEHVLVGYLKDGNVGKKRPTIRLGGGCGCGGEKVDAIDYYTYVYT